MAPIYSPIGHPFTYQMDAHLQPQLVIKTRAYSSRNANIFFHLVVTTDHPIHLFKKKIVENMHYF